MNLFFNWVKIKEWKTDKDQPMCEKIFPYFLLNNYFKNKTITDIDYLNVWKTIHLLHSVLKWMRI